MDERLRDYMDEGDKATDVIDPTRGTQRDRVLARKNVMKYLPYLSAMIERTGVRTLSDYADVERQKAQSFARSGAYYTPIPHEYNMNSVLRAGASPLVIKTMVTEPLKTYGTSRNYNKTKEEALEDWSALLRRHDYHDLARDLDAHSAGLGRIMETITPSDDVEDDEVEFLGASQDPEFRVVNGSGYRITQHTKKQAKKLGVEVKPSQLAKKKIDVFRGGRKVASVGHKDYCDFPTYRECCGTKMANARREAYKTRHDKTRHKEGTPSFYADKLLW